MPVHPTRCVLGVDFFIGSLADAVNRALAVSLPGESDNAERLAEASPASVRLIVAPSAPGLAVDLVKSNSYREALTTADLVLTDSGFMVLLWRAFTGEKLPRHSGLKFIRAVLDRPELKQPGAVFWVMPSAEEDVRNRAWLRGQGFPVTAADVYLAPHYQKGTIRDDELVRRIKARSPRIVMLAIGGGVQERVGLMLRAQLGGGRKSEDGEQNTAGGRRTEPMGGEGPSIFCLGAAIAFLTGGQATIPPWADKLILGWLLRLLSNPRKFWRRYWEALSLARLVWCHRDRLPPMANGDC
jgi:UDP-N-acetyl-D-mannosaminuronic acid transferase (WecB/TagA/CpsF family)